MESLNSESEDDVWGSDTEIDPSKKLKDVHYKNGYVDGITSAKDQNLQQGFDETFTLGADLGYRVGRIIGKLQTLVLFYGKTDEALCNDYASALEHLKIGKVLSKSNFDTAFKSSYNIKELDRWEEKIKFYTELHISK